MKRVYSTPVVNFEEYRLTTQVAGACKDANKIIASTVEGITMRTIHCEDSKGVPSRCSHYWTLSDAGTIFNDGAATGPNTCDHDVSSVEEGFNLMNELIKLKGSNISGDYVTQSGTGNVYFSFKGTGQGLQHTGYIDEIDFNNYFKS